MRKMTWLAGLALGLTLTAGGAEALAAAKIAGVDRVFQTGGAGSTPAGCLKIGKLWV